MSVRWLVLVVGACLLLSPIHSVFAAAERGPRCSDGFDNDGDGLVDLADPDCSGSKDTEARIAELEAEVAALQLQNTPPSVEIIAPDYSIRNFEQITINVDSANTLREVKFIPGEDFLFFEPTYSFSESITTRIDFDGEVQELYVVDSHGNSVAVRHTIDTDVGFTLGEYELETPVSGTLQGTGCDTAEGTTSFAALSLELRYYIQEPRYIEQCAGTPYDEIPSVRCTIEYCGANLDSGICLAARVQGDFQASNGGGDSFMVQGALPSRVSDTFSAERGAYTWGLLDSGGAILGTMEGQLSTGATPTISGTMRFICIDPVFGVEELGAFPFSAFLVQPTP